MINKNNLPNWAVRIYAGVDNIECVDCIINTSELSPKDQYCVVAQLVAEWLVKQ